MGPADILGAVRTRSAPPARPPLVPNGCVLAREATIWAQRRPCEAASDRPLADVVMMPEKSLPAPSPSANAAYSCCARRPILASVPVCSIACRASPRSFAMRAPAKPGW